MAATAAAAVGSSFSTAIQTLKYTKSFHTTTTNKLSFSHNLGIGPISISIIPTTSRRLWVPRAAVTEEEVALNAPTAVEEEEAVEDKAEVVEEEVSGDQENVHNTGIVGTKLYIGNLPYLCDSAQLAGIIQDYGSPELVEVLYDRNTGKSRGFAFVTMSTVEDCQAVIDNLDGSEYGGRTLRVNFADKPRAKEPLYPETEYKLFIGNLSWSVTSESLTQLFQDYGTVIGARVLYDGETGRSRGYGFVCFPTQEEMESALQALNGVELEGRAIRVGLAEGKRQ